MRCLLVVLLASYAFPQSPEANPVSGATVCVAPLTNQSHLTMDASAQRDGLIQAINNGAQKKDAKGKVNAAAVEGNSPESAQKNAHAQGCRYLVVAHFHTEAESGRIQTAPTGTDNKKAELSYRISSVDTSAKPDSGTIRVVFAGNEGAAVSESVRQLATRVVKAAGKGK
jgi:hypothetical protein